MSDNSSAIEEILNSNTPDVPVFSNETLHISIEMTDHSNCTELTGSSGEFEAYYFLGIDNRNNSNRVNLNDVYIHSGMLMIPAYLVLATFIFYVPRMIYYRVSRATKDRQLPGYFMLWYLSLIACIAGVIHFGSFQVFVSGSPVFNASTFEDQLNTFYLLKAATFSINRLVAPVVAVICLQQIATHTQYSIPILQETGVHVIMCLVLTVFVVGYSFGREYFFMAALTPSSPVYPDHVHLDLYDLIAPIITTALFFFARQNLERQSVYSIEKVGPSDPSTLDRVSKVVIFQAVMVIFTIGSVLMAPSEEEELHSEPKSQPTSVFFISAQTPFVHWVLLRSLLRRRKPTRLCFLMCFGGEEKVGVAPEDNMEMGEQRAGSANQNQKQEEEEEEEEEPETLDANKIVILPESQAEEVIRREALEMAEAVEIRAEDIVEEGSLSDENVEVPARNDNQNMNGVSNPARNNNQS